MTARNAGMYQSACRAECVWQVHAAIRANPGGEKKEAEPYSGEKQPKRKAAKLSYDERKRNVKVLLPACPAPGSALGMPAHCALHCAAVPAAGCHRLMARKLAMILPEDC